jgi:hypothetical protein
MGCQGKGIELTFDPEGIDTSAATASSTGVSENKYGIVVQVWLYY